MNSILHFLYFIVEDDKSVRLLTFVWYTAEKCKKAQLIEVNSFSKVTFRWKSDQFEIDKFTDLHGCDLNVQCRGEFDFSYATVFAETLNSVFGALASSMNFTPKMSSIKSLDMELFKSKKDVDLHILRGCLKDKDRLMEEYWKNIFT